jgi:hypothetical protein
VFKKVWKVFEHRNFPSQHGDSASFLLDNFYSATCKEEVPLGYGKILLLWFPPNCREFTEDTGVSGACHPPPPVTAGCSIHSGEISELYEINMQMGKWTFIHVVR